MLQPAAARADNIWPNHVTASRWAATVDSPRNTEVRSAITVHFVLPITLMTSFINRHSYVDSSLRVAIHYSEILYAMKTILWHTIDTAVSTDKVKLINFKGKTALETRE